MTWCVAGLVQFTSLDQIETSVHICSAHQRLQSKHSAPISQGSRLLIQMKASSEAALMSGLVIVAFKFGTNEVTVPGSPSRKLVSSGRLDGEASPSPVLHHMLENLNREIKAHDALKEKCDHPLEKKTDVTSPLVAPGVAIQGHRRGHLLRFTERGHVGSPNELFRQTNKQRQV